MVNFVSAPPHRFNSISQVSKHNLVNKAGQKALLLHHRATRFSGPIKPKSNEGLSKLFSNMWGRISRIPKLFASTKPLSSKGYEETNVRPNTLWGHLRGRNDDIKMNPKLETKIAQNHLNSAKLAVNAYKDSGAPPGFSRLSGDALTKLGIDPTLLNNEKTGFTAAVYKNEETGSYTLAFRGTDEAVDWTHSNIPQSLGNKPHSYKQALKLTEQIIGAAGKDKVNLVGHSLGGGLANYAAVHHNVDFTIFNAAGLSNKLIDNLKGQGPYTATGTVINDEHDPLTNHAGRFTEETYGGQHYGQSETIWVENKQFSDFAVNPGKRLLAHSLASNIIPYLGSQA